MVWALVPPFASVSIQAAIWACVYLLASSGTAQV